MSAVGLAGSDVNEDRSAASCNLLSTSLMSNFRSMSAPSARKHCELQLICDPALYEVVRAFVRETALAESVPVTFASLIANDCAQAWLALSVQSTANERARVSVSLTRCGVRARIVLSGQTRFANAVGLLSERLQRDADISYREIGIDHWEVSLHRSLNNRVELQPQAPMASPLPGSPKTLNDIRVELPDRSDATYIARCFLEVYGHHYVHSYVYSPNHYWSRVDSGELIPVIARNSEGQVIGHVALEREAGSLVAERGEAVVLPDYRGHHLLELMTERLSEEAPKRGLLGVYAEPLTIHTFSQRNDEHAGMPVCAVLLGANPESFRPRDISCPTAGQRQSYLRTFRFLEQPAERTVRAPALYQDVMQKIYESLGVAVKVVAPSDPVSKQSRTGIKVNDRGYAVIQFDQIGANCAIELAQALNDVRALGARSVQLTALVTDPGLELLIIAARSLGFFFCGLAPAFANGADLLLLQLLDEPLDTTKLQLFTDRAKELVAFIEHDRREVCSS